MSRLEKLRQRLDLALAPLRCELIDDSASHAGHAGAASGGSHYNLKIICHQFEGLNRISRHRLVYDAVGDMMHTEVHALAIVALTPTEMPT
ncbi:MULTISPECIES: BolA family protein [unclassified Undibacterium]|uniref:BolA family protein n=1 Tax=unclassified Undibacterium TaxID=2630295 RepID=UPI002AC9BE32|nr:MULTISPECIES: BolA family protein [unclassified Undibacterium]MEB0141058.1 BolA family protein [Undibacterium sp. CCC2.1]MEB0174030.1 BolA family protein [Undibacterium sp. CCC1.1]MEB0177999.1 BolA family protein [Undibacterium sp. CCC3.4]MEB0217229.1 BolA family protein [Undibacterium sp. 5I2]WPX43282.1 BolA family protein [Undibacterium sp. CCC3.4]